MVHALVNKRVFRIPPLGMLVFHPGVTPEYKGVHAAFWATMNHEYEGIGWSLLRINEGIDTGQVLAQGATRGVNPLDESHIVMQHKAHVDGLPHVVEVLRRLEAGEEPRVSMENRQGNDYTHPGLSDYFELRRRNKALRHRAAAAATRSNN
jgi:methionyl-tRNA formyltransferase